MKKILSILTVLLIVLSLASCKTSAPSSSGDSSQITASEGFERPESYASVLNIKINPEFNLYLDSKGTVLALEAVNDDAKTFFGKISIQNKTFMDVFKDILKEATTAGFIKNNAVVAFEIVENKGGLNDEDILNKASDALNLAAKEIDVAITLSITQNTTSDISSKIDDNSKPNVTSKPSDNSKPTTTSTSSENSKPTESAKPTSSVPTESIGVTQKDPVKPSSSEPPKTTTTEFLNPDEKLQFEKEYAGNYRLGGSGLIGSGISFHKEGGIDENPYCLLLSPDFEATQTDPNQVVREYNGKKYYCIGSGMTPHIMEITSTEIIVKNSFYDDEEKISLKLRLKYDDSFVVTFSSLPEYPVGLVLSYLRG